MGLQVADDAVHVGHGALVLILDDGVAVLAPGRVGRPKGAEDGSGGGRVGGIFGLDVVGNFGDETVEQSG